MKSPEQTPALDSVADILAAARALNISTAALCRAAEPPIHNAQVSRWAAGQEPRRRQIERLRAAFFTLAGAIA